MKRKNYYRISKEFENFLRTEVLQKPPHTWYGLYEITASLTDEFSKWVDEYNRERLICICPECEYHKNSPHNDLSYVLVDNFEIYIKYSQCRMHPINYCAYFEAKFIINEIS